MYVSLKKAVYEVMKLSLIVPCYNEESNVEAFYNETEKAFSGVSFDYEYVFINDGSKDKTL
ncbi:MAG: glycosyltransferase, partial [Ruminococcus sp.]